MPQPFIHLKTNWKQEWIPSVRNHLIVSSIILLTLIHFSPQIFYYLQTRETVVLSDPIIQLITPIDFSIPIFIMTYSSLLGSIIYHLYFPKRAIQFIQTYALLLIFRMICIYLTPLSPSEQIVFLNDPIVNSMISSEIYIDKDLFFSGHTSTLFLLYFLVENKKLKRYILACCCIVPILLVGQHTHYTIDVVIAPMVAYFIYKLQKKLVKL